MSYFIPVNKGMSYFSNFGCNCT